MTSTARFTRSYVALLVAVMVAVSFSILTIVGSYLINNKRADAQDLMTVVTQTFADNRPNWRYFAMTARVNPHRSFVRVHVAATPHASARTYYSRGTRQFLRTELDTVPLSAHVRYQQDRGVYYHLTKTTTNRGAVVTYSEWLSLNNMVGLFKVLLLAIIGITLVGILIGGWLISWLAHRLNAPLVALTDVAHTIANTDNATHHETLPVPSAPQEVHELGSEFNRLLQSLNAQVRRDHQFVSDASHELRTPLSAIRGHVALIRRHGSDHPEVIPESLATIDVESSKMQQLVESLLRLSRMDHMSLTRDWVPIAPLLQRCGQRFERQSGRLITVAATGDTLVFANAESIERVVMSLLSNAAKYSPAALPITLSLTVNGSTAAIAVADLGPGVADSDKPHIFDRFYRADSSRSKAIPGTGLGLAIAARSVALNHGQLSVADHQPHGAVFTLTLPAMPAPAAE